MHANTDLSLSLSTDGISVMSGRPGPSIYKVTHTSLAGAVVEEERLPGVARMQEPQQDESDTIDRVGFPSIGRTCLMQHHHQHQQHHVRHA